MEFGQVLRRRRMIRRYLPARPVSRTQLDRLIEAAVRAPSAGSSQGWHFLVLDDSAAIDGFWSVTADLSTPADAWLTGMRTAPALIVVLSDRGAYVQRYAETDKGPPADPPAELDRRWPVPYWHLDAAMAALLILLCAVDDGLGACWFGVPTDRVDALRQRFALPAELVPVGVIAVGYPDPTYRAKGLRPRRAAADVTSYGSYGTSANGSTGLDQSGSPSAGR